MPLDSARQVLGVIAGSIIGVGGVAFSVTIVALTLTSGQCGPKILRNFLEDDLSKVTLGLFLGTYVYMLIVLTGYAQADSPQFTVLVSLLLAFFALFAYVGFIHRTATDLQAEKIVHRIGEQLERALQELAARALSPGINDPGTAITCIDWFSLGLARIVDRDLPGCVFLDQDRRPRLLARASRFSGIMKAIYTPLRQFASSDSAVVASLLESLCRLSELTRRAERLSILAMHGEEIWSQIRPQPVSDHDLRDIHRRYLKLRLFRPE